jgi:mRNA-degrading endonuclease HigB of HigAB toxin-antitoxin module
MTNGPAEIGGRVGIRERKASHWHKNATTLAVAFFQIPANPWLRVPSGFPPSATRPSTAPATISIASKLGTSPDAKYTENQLRGTRRDPIACHQQERMASGRRGGPLAGIGGCGMAQNCLRPSWHNLMDVRKVYPSADRVGPYTVFNIKGNVYRLIVKIEYRWQMIFVKHLLTHAEYERKEWTK